MHKRKSLFFVCAETSGDLLTAELIDGLRTVDPTIEVSGIVGEACAAKGVSSLVPLHKISAMGLFEIIAVFFKVKKAIKKALDYIQTHPVDIVICVDGFAFTHLIAKAVHQKHPHIKIIKYVPPKLWAWGAWRMKKLKIYDLILATLPFETDFFKQYQIETDFVGHSVLNRIPAFDPNKEEAFCKKYTLIKTQKVILLLPGSRRSEIKRLLPLFIESAASFPHYTVLLPMADKQTSLIHKLLPKNHNITLIPSEDRFTAFHKADYALAASGTVSLELMMTNTPAVIAYKVSPITAFVAQFLVKVKYASLLNIIFNKEIFPEYIQEKCTFDTLVTALQNLMNNPAESEKQLHAFEKGKELLHCSQSSYINIIRKILQ